MKLYKIYLKIQVSFSLTLYHSSVLLDITLLYFFSWNFYYFDTRSPSKCRISYFQFHQSCTLIGSFYWKNIKCHLKMYRGVMSHDTKEWCRTWRKANLLFQQWQEFGEFWSEHSKVSKICILIGCFHAKYIAFDLKKYRRVIFHDTAELCKIRRNTDLWFGKLHKEFGKISSEQLESVKIGTFMGSFCLKQKMHELKIYRGVICNDTEKWWKIWRGIGLLFQNWHKEFDKIWLKHSKVSKMYTLMGCFWPKYIMF